MFEIGSTLREARERQAIELAQVERETRIRARYLKALEDERFDLIPGEAYARSFLREYAEHLGLDATPFVDEFESRVATDEEPAMAPRGLPVPRRLPPYTGLAVAAVAFLGLVAWQLESGRSSSPGIPAGGATVAGTTATRTQTTPVRERARPPAPALVLTALRGRCWIAARLGGRDGRLVWEGTLESGRSLRFRARSLWLRLGAPANLGATLGGKSVALPTRTASVLVTSRGLRTVGA